MTFVGNVGTRLNLLIKQGCSFFQPLRITTDGLATSPMLDLSGQTLRAQMRHLTTPRDDAPAAEFLCLLFPEEEEYNAGLYLSAISTAAIPAGRSPLDALSQYAWDLERVLSDSVTVFPVCYGVVRIHPEITR